MSVEQNKEVARKTWEAAVKGDIDTATANISDEVSWLLPASVSPGGPLKGKQAVAGFFKSLGTAFPSGMKTEIRRVYGDGDTVLMELTNRGQTAKGKQYENEYCFVLEFEGGKIRRVREYTDTAKVKEVFS
ncbi:MAG TPA: nuclear transport factor 2 family protein [Candidatus Binataceae bacterium]|jgi:ketosteroid isomerase-like protein|nr:nuclear transport factor 2 family protein [Candidatus Binataceae bacterium]